MKVLDIRVAGKSIGVKPSVLNDGDAIVDSGTSDVNLPASVLHAVRSSFGDLCSDRSMCLKGVCDCTQHKPLLNPIFDNRCVHMDSADRDAFPVIEVDFSDGLTVPYSPTKYLRSGAEFCDDEGQYTIAIESSGPDGSGTIFGDTFMQGFTVIHDRVKQRIGFAPVLGGKCP